MTSKELVLYNSALGPFARIVRLQLAEKGIPYVTKDVSLSKGENILPWYVSLNPKMTVPTLTIGEKGAEEPEVVLSDSYDIIQYLENELNQGTSLVSSDPAETKQIWEIVDKWYALEMSHLYIGKFRVDSKPMFDMYRDMQSKQMAKVEENAKKYPDLKEAYEKKQEKIKHVKDKVFDSPGSFDEAQKHKEQLLDETEAMLSGEGDWLLSSYSIADVVLTCMLCNLLMFGLLDLKSRPAISKYLDSVKKRPSYKQAHISDTLPWTMRAILIPVLIIQRIKSIFTK